MWWIIKFLAAGSKLAQPLPGVYVGFEPERTNTDPVLPTEDGFVPGAGAIVRALETASGKLPLVIGKPNQPIMDIMIDHLGLDVSKCTVVGDRLDTDILAGTRCGMRTVLVLSEVETRIVLSGPILSLTL